MVLQSVKRKFVVLFFIVFSSVFILNSPAYAIVTRTAYQVKFTHNDPWYNPHYGAYFVGAYGIPGSAVFHGFSGSYSGYAWNNWWGFYSNVELLSKSWLFAPACYIGGTPTTCPDRWTGSEHEADFGY